MGEIVPSAAATRVLWDAGFWLLLVAGWVTACLWVHEDSRNVFGRSSRWPLAFVATGALLLALTFEHGLGEGWLFTIVFLVGLGVYLQHRDSRAPVPDRILTVETARTVLLAATAHTLLQPMVRKWLANIDPEPTDSTTAKGVLFCKTSGQASGGVDHTSRSIRPARELFERAIAMRASEIRLFTRSDGATFLRYRIDGIKQQVTTLPNKTGLRATAALKGLAGMRDGRQRGRQTGAFRVFSQGQTIDVRATATPTAQGEKLSLRLRNSDGALARQRLEGIGLEPDQIDSIRRLIEQPHGMLLVTGPSGSGKTLTAYTAINELLALSRTVATVEDPIEYLLPGVEQNAVQSGGDRSFFKIFRGLLSRDPDVILVGDLRDKETADLALESALAGHFVFSTLNAHDASAAVSHLLDLGISARLLQTALSAVLAQRLIRVLCDHCKEPYRAPAEFHIRLKIPADQHVVIYRKNGCESCRGTGYSGRRVVSELLVLDGRIRDMLHLSPSLQAIRSAARQAGMQTLRESALEQVRRGVTSLEEIIRVTNVTK
jgi:general secretion pathway protein E